MNSSITPTDNNNTSNNNNQITQETLLKNSIINLANNLSQAQQANKNNIVQGLMNNNTSNLNPDQYLNNNHNNLNNNRFVDPTSVDSQVLQPNLNSYKNIEKIITLSKDRRQSVEWNAMETEEVAPKSIQPLSLESISEIQKDRNHDLVGGDNKNNGDKDPAKEEEDEDDDAANSDEFDENGEKRRSSLKENNLNITAEAKAKIQLENGEIIENGSIEIEQEKEEDEKDN